MGDHPQPQEATKASPLAAILNIVILAGLLYIFLLAIALFGGAFKMAGKGFAEQLIETTTNPVIGLMIGLLATSLIQSSSSTTSIIVGMVAGGVLTVNGAVPIIMGANMGTTVTNTLVAMTSMNRRTEFQRAFAGATMHDFFNLMSIAILFPIEQSTHFLEKSATWLSTILVGADGTKFPNPVKAAVKPVVNQIKHLLQDTGLENMYVVIIMVVIALVGIFFALTFLTKVLKRMVLDKAEGAFTKNLRKSSMAAMFIGLLVTVGVQSSSITTSLLVPLIGAGIVPLESAFAATLGANIGTTVTALLASMTGTPGAVTIALVHLLFNISGIILIYPFGAVRRSPLRMATGLAAATSEKKYYAILYMLGIFFVMPLLFVLIDKLLKAA
ncbi:MAG: sodium dependent phosphate transporter [bacterium]|nr:sodium dependent phosphate transporter [bacterium]